MSYKRVELEVGKHKKYEILALLLHFYNNKFILDQAYHNHMNEVFEFVEIEKRNNYSTTERFYMPDYMINTSNSIDASYRYYHGDAGGTFKAKFILELDGKKTHQFYYEYDENINIRETIITTLAKGFRRYGASEFENRFIKAQNKIIDIFKFYELNIDYILSKIHIEKNMNSFFVFKPYIDEIRKEEHDYETYYDFCDAAKNEMENGREYVMKHFLKIRRTRNNITIKIGNIFVKNISLDVKEFTPFLEVFIPILKKLGGIQELKNLIYTQRLLEE